MTENRPLASEVRREGGERNSSRLNNILYIRPDGESPGQPPSADLAKAAEEHGIVLTYFPVEKRKVDGDVAAEFMKVADALKRPLLVCGRSGGHATSVWESAELAESG